MIRKEEYFVQMFFIGEKRCDDGWAIVAPLTKIGGTGYLDKSLANQYIESRKNTKHKYRILKRVTTEEVI